MILCLLVVVLSIHAAKAQDFTAYERKLFIRGADTLRYRILYPENYKKEQPYPLIVFLHGAGERGHDNEHQIDLGTGLFLKDSVRKNSPLFLSSPVP